MSKHVKVNPCPFCGSGNILELSGHSVSWMVCDDCKAEGPVGTVSWDSRAPSPAFEAMVEALEWYAERLQHVRKNHGEGDTARAELSADCSARADAALALARGER